MPGKYQRKLHTILDDIVNPNLNAERQLILLELTNHPLLERYRLHPLDAQVVARVWLQQKRDEDQSVDQERLVEIIGRPEWSLAEQLRYTGTLIDRCVLNTLTPLESDYRRFPEQLLRADFRLSSRLAYLIMELAPELLIADNLDYYPYTERRLLEMVEEAFNLISAYYWEADEKLIRQIDFSYPDYYLECIRPLANILRFGMDKPFSRAIRKAGLSFRETAIVVYLLHCRIHDLDSVEPERLCRLVSSNPSEEAENGHLLHSDSRLCQSGIVTWDDGDLALDEDIIEVGDRSETYMVELRQETDPGPGGTPSPSPQALQKLPASHTLDSLILPERDMSLLRAALQRFKLGNYADLTKWGVKTNTGSGLSKNNGLIALFYGPPGTGKTFAAGAIAGELRKDLLGIDATQLRNHWFGDSEKLVRRIFQRMAEMVYESEHPPVFLLNECDQLIHRRDASPVGSDNTENAIQNIILEQLEQFPGILIMTTNLMENIDNAYFRRFNIKVEFSLPDEECRLRLWQAHLPSTIPGAEQIPVADLARDFHFTGGQISLIVQNACLEAITREGDERRLLLQDLLKYARQEQHWVGKGRKASIGFGAAITQSDNTNLNETIATEQGGTG